MLNVECAISDRGVRWSDPRKPFFFRAPPVATEVLQRLGVTCVTLANNHALDYGPEALDDTFRHLANAGIAWVGAGINERDARTPRLGDVEEEEAEEPERQSAMLIALAFGHELQVRGHGWGSRHRTRVRWNEGPRPGEGAIGPCRPCGSRGLAGWHRPR